MTAPSTAWVRVSRTRPCPVCSKPDWCLVAPDGSAAICPRISEGAAKDLGASGYLHRLENDLVFEPVGIPSPRLTAAKNRKPPEHWTELAKTFASNANARRQELAHRLGVSDAAFKSLGIGYSEESRFWTIPERDETGQVIGIQRRYRDGDKRHIPGGARGLTYAPNVLETPGP